jgi:hypothetical protein
MPSLPLSFIGDGMVLYSPGSQLSSQIFGVLGVAKVKKYKKCFPAGASQLQQEQEIICGKMYKLNEIEYLKNIAVSPSYGLTSPRLTTGGWRVRQAFLRGLSPQALEVPL